MVAFCADLGQAEELATVRERAAATGASEVFVDDLREEFVRDFVFPMLRANAVYEGGYLLGTSIARPLIAKRQIEIARADRRRRGRARRDRQGQRPGALRAHLLCARARHHRDRAVARRGTSTRAPTLIAYAERHRIPVPVTREKPYSSDRNLLHISYEGGILEDPWREPYADMFVLTVAPEQAPDQPEYVEVDYEARRSGGGERRRGSRRPLCSRELNALGGRHGVGRLDLVENRYVGMKSRGVYETPGGTLLLRSASRRRVADPRSRGDAPARLARAALRRDGLLRLLVQPRAPHAAGRDRRVAARRHRHGAPQALQGQRHRRGPTRGALALRSRRSRPSKADSIYDQADAEGFIRLAALRLRIQALVASATQRS